MPATVAVATTTTATAALAPDRGRGSLGRRRAWRRRPRRSRSGRARDPRSPPSTRTSPRLQRTPAPVIAPKRAASAIFRRRRLLWLLLLLLPPLLLLLRLASRCMIAREWSSQRLLTLLTARSEDYARGRAGGLGARRPHLRGRRAACWRHRRCRRGSRAMVATRRGTRRPLPATAPPAPRGHPSALVVCRRWTRGQVRPRRERCAARHSQKLAGRPPGGMCRCSLARRCSRAAPAPAPSGSS
eukprot:scaffold1127_cov361-Prasinococcus_capsulatus_cf.AAC.3